MILLILILFIFLGLIVIGHAANNFEGGLGAAFLLGLVFMLPILVGTVLVVLH